MNTPNALLTRRLAGCVLAGTLLGAVAACGQVAAPHSGGHGGSGHPTINGQVVTLTGYHGAAVVSADGRTITIGGFPGPCFGTVQASARESAHQVKLFLRYVAPKQHGVCNEAVVLVLTRSVRLHAPLGHRELVDGKTGRPVAVFDGRLTLRPSALPAGLKFRYLSPVALAGGALLGASEQAGCSQFYSSHKATLTIVQTSGHLSLPPGGRGRPVKIKVRGQAGEASAGAITWQEHGLSMLITDTSIGSGKPALTVKQLIAIADSAPPIPAAGS